MQIQATFVQSKYKLSELFHNLNPFLSSKSPFFTKQKQINFTPQQFFDSLLDFQVLVVGAGGLGCQIVKNLALSGIRNIHLVDMDTIDLTNLNRQFLFRQKNIGRYKAQVVAEFIMKRCPGVKVTAYNKKVQSFTLQFYQKFAIIIGGLDNVEARKFLNYTAHQLNKNQSETICFYIDGSTEKLGGQAIIIEPYVTSCYNCSRKGFNEKMKSNYCTIASTPRTPQHCIQYVIQLKWSQEFPNRKMDTDNLEDMKWVHQESLKRAQQFQIQGVTEMLTMGVAKNIIPAVASTNALIAAICTNQALKIISDIHPRLDNYFVYSGESRIGGFTESLMKEPDCQTCNLRKNQIPDLHISMQGSCKLQDLIKEVRNKFTQIGKPFITIKQKTVGNPADKNYLQRMNMTLLQLKQRDFITHNPETIHITHTSLKCQLKVILKIQ